MHTVHISTPLGAMIVRTTDAGIRELKFMGVELQEGQPISRMSAPKSADEPTAIINLLLTELEQYFAGTLTKFTVLLDPLGTDFQLNVWKSLSAIPYGVTRSYKDQAINIGNLQAIRAVAKANGDNPIAILIPCHRVVGSSGELTGYAGGLWRKRALLDLEQRKSKPKLF